MQTKKERKKKKEFKIQLFYWTRLYKNVYWSTLRENGSRETVQLSFMTIRYLWCCCSFRIFI